MKTYQVTIQESHLRSFFKSLPTHTCRAYVKEILTASGLVWNRYWEFEKEVKRFFVQALLWAEITPTAAQVKKILLEETLKSPINELVDSLHWWSDSPTPVVKRAIASLSTEEFTKASKKWKIETVINFAPEEYLPLLIGDKRLTNYSTTKLEGRLKGKKE